MKVARQYINISKQLARYQQHLSFNSRCKCYSIIPTYLRVRPLIPSAEGFRIANRYSRQSFNAQISLNHRTISHLCRELDEQFVSLGELFSESEVNFLRSLQEKAHTLETLKCKIRQKAKFDCLTQREGRRTQIIDGSSIYQILLSVNLSWKFYSTFVCSHLTVHCLS